MVFGHQLAQHALAFEEWLVTQIAAIQPHQIKGTVAGFAATHHQVCED
jgi:hypothetical protein